MGGSPLSVLVNMQKCDIVANEFELRTLKLMALGLIVPLPSFKKDGFDIE